MEIEVQTSTTEDKSTLQAKLKESKVTLARQKSELVSYFSSLDSWSKSLFLTQPV